MSETTQRQTEQQEKAERLQQRKTLNWARKRLKKRYMDVSPADTFPNSEGIYIFGGVGTGKTYLTSQLFLRWCLDNEPCEGSMFWDFPYLLEKMRQEVRDNKPERNSIIQSCMDCPLLVIDDLGSERATDWTLDRLSMIINHRYSEMKPIIITSNLNIEEIAQFSARIASRMSVLTSIEMNGIDRRIAE